MNTDSDYAIPHNTWIFRKTREVYNLRNTVHRYWKRLVEESLEKARAERIEVVLVGGNGKASEGPFSVNVYIRGEFVDADKLIELSESRLPSLFRRYHAGKERYLREISVLEASMPESTDKAHSH